MAVTSSKSLKAYPLLERWFTAPAGLASGEERVYAAFAVGAPSALLLHFFYIFLFAYWGVKPLAIFNILGVIIFAFVIIFTRHLFLHRPRRY